MNNKTAIVILNWNSFNLTSECIESILEVKDCEFDIIVIDNASKDNSGTKLKQKFPEIILMVQAQNIGFAGGNNVAFKYAIELGYKYILMLNNDVIVTSSFLKNLYDYMEINPEVGAVQPIIYYNHDRSKIWNAGGGYLPILGLTSPYSREGKDSDFLQIIKEVEWISGCAFFIRASVLNEVGYLNVKYFMYYEDVDLSFRIRKAGYSLVIVPSAKIFHIVGASTRKVYKIFNGKTLAFVYYYKFRNWIWFLKQHAKIIYLPTIIITVFMSTLSHLIYFISMLRFKKFYAVCLGIRDGLKSNGSV